MIISLDEAQAIAKDAKARLYPDYSGRGMYGARCVGFVLPVQRIASVGAAAVNVLGAVEARELLSHSATDDMGLDTIVYFPYVSVAA